MIARIGGGLLISGVVGAAAAVALAAPGAAADLSSGLPTAGGSGVLLAVFLVLTATGLLCLGWSEVPSFLGRGVAYGSRSLSIGLLALSGVLLASGSRGLPGTAIDILLVPLVGAALATIVGAIVMGLALVRELGPARLAGLILVSGVLLVVVGMGQEWQSAGTDCGHDRGGRPPPILRRRTLRRRARLAPEHPVSFARRLTPFERAGGSTGG